MMKMLQEKINFGKTECYMLKTFYLLFMLPAIFIIPEEIIRLILGDNAGDIGVVVYSQTDIIMCLIVDIVVFFGLVPLGYKLLNKQYVVTYLIVGVLSLYALMHLRHIPWYYPWNFENDFVLFKTLKLLLG